MGRKIYTQSQMNEAVLNAKNEARLSQIHRSAQIMQELKNENERLEQNMIKANEKIVSMQEELDAGYEVINNVNAENARLKSGHA